MFFTTFGGSAFRGEGGESLLLGFWGRLLILLFTRILEIALRELLLLFD